MSKKGMMNECTENGEDVGLKKKKKEKVSPWHP